MFVPAKIHFLYDKNVDNFKKIGVMFDGYITLI